MLRKLRPRSAYDVMAAIAFFIAVAGGSAYAAATIGAGDIKSNAVLSRHIKNGAVRNPDLAANSVGTANVIDGSLRKRDFKPGQLSASGPASGDLTGNYPGPRVRPAVFTDASTLVDNNSATCLVQNNGKWVNDNPNVHLRAAYYRDPLGIVHLHGDIKNCAASSVIIFTLPAGFKPARTEQFAAEKDGSSTTVVGVDPLGEVTNSTVANNHVLSLSGLTFRCAPAGQDGCP